MPRKITFSIGFCLASNVDMKQIIHWSYISVRKDVFYEMYMHLYLILLIIIALIPDQCQSLLSSFKVYCIQVMLKFAQTNSRLKKIYSEIWYLNYQISFSSVHYYGDFSFMHWSVYDLLSCIKISIHQTKIGQILLWGVVRGDSYLNRLLKLILYCISFLEEHQ